MSKKRQKIKVIGCGSLFMGEDAVGCIAARKLKDQKLPDNVEVLEIDITKQDLLNSMKQAERVIIISAMVTGKKEAGEFSIYNEDNFPEPPQGSLKSSHATVKEAIEKIKELPPKSKPDLIEIWGIEVKVPLLKTAKFSENVWRAMLDVIEKLKIELLHPEEV